MASDLMIDLETLGTTPGCAIVSIGAVRFEREGDGTLGLEFYTAVRLTSCTDAGLTICPETLCWWMERADCWPEQDGAADLTKALRSLTGFLGEERPRRIWAHGAPFDPPILAAAYRAAGLSVPWSRYEIRDTRTLFDLAGHDFHGDAHHALHDAQAQARAVLVALKKLRGGAEAR